MQNKCPRENVPTKQKNTKSNVENAQQSSTILKLLYKISELEYRHLCQMKFQHILYIIFRLAVNYVESEAAEEKLDDIHSKCSLQFSGKVIVPSKDVFSKEIITVIS